MTLEEEINSLNQQCFKCQAAFRKDGIEFSSSMCRYCDTGTKLHRLLVQANPGERKWGAIDWNSSQYEKYYNG